MKYLVIVILFSFTSLIVDAQKPTIKTDTFGKWTTISRGEISNNGKYIAYFLTTYKSGERTLIIKNNKKKLIGEYQNAISSIFTEDSKYAIINKNDSILIVSLKDGRIKSAPMVKDFKLFNLHGQQWILIHHSNLDLEYFPLTETHGRVIKKVNDFTISPSNRNLIIQKNNADRNYIVELMDLTSGTVKTIYSGAKSSSYIFDLPERQLAFYVEIANSAKSDFSIYYYNTRLDSAKKIICNESLGIPNGMVVSNMNTSYGSWSFSKNGENIFFNLADHTTLKAKQESIKVNIWSYKDAQLQSQQAGSSKSSAYYLSSYNLKSNSIYRLVGNNERVVSGIKKDWNDKYIIVEKNVGDINEWYWNDSARQSTYLISTLTGERKTIELSRREYLSQQKISPHGDYLVYYDSGDRNYFCYEIKTGKSRNLTKDIETEWTGILAKDYSSTAVGICGWYEDGNVVIIGDRYDLWLINLKDKAIPINLTNNYKKFISILNTNYNPDKIYKYNDILMVKSFDLSTYDNTLQTLKLGNSKGLKKLTSGSYIYNLDARAFYYMSSEGAIQKAKDNESYLLTRQSAESSPNIYLTTDFKKFTDISDNHPERSVNWLTTELHQYKLNDGTPVNSVLYKPEDFDPKKKYPVILQYYTVEESFKKNAFPMPRPTGTTINIPYMVSNGYIVFLIDIKFAPGKTGQSALESALGATNYLSANEWIDSVHVGINGHSFGGFETDYIISHTNRFSAALSASGASNLISNYNSIWGISNASGLGFSKQQLYEKGYYNMTGSLWESQNEYLANSAILYADRINTPLLLMNNKNDPAVAFSQGLELFIALRRLKKTVWLLEYDGQGHNINDFDMAVDYCIRQKQFFDHYLKGSPMPRWMSNGIPFELKGIDDGIGF